MTTEQPNLDARTLRVLRAIFELSRSGRATHVGVLASELGLPPKLVIEDLARLDLAGFLRARTGRLTMRGLVLALQLAGTRAQGRSVPAQPYGELHRLGGRAARAPVELPAGFRRAVGS